MRKFLKKYVIICPPIIVYEVIDEEPPAPEYTYAKWNAGDASVVISVSGAGNNVATHIGGVASWAMVRADIGIASGKGQWECVGADFATYCFAGAWANSTANLAVYAGVDNNSGGYLSDGSKYANGGSTAGFATVAPTDIVTTTLDMNDGLSTGSASFYKNGAFQFTITGIPIGTIYPAGALYEAGSSITINTGQTPLAFPVEGYPLGVFTS